ncbi:uncharacterized protein LOC108668347 [Hyalella azteca]|uniref:Uncharacterized protein LOC108668347 n=1 Tax=Hyalella azteca TaxID=294128 RepID=A0A8B7NBQ9_HYAAZ|nr:uncharacterized protein LOC108668347 [Hyalella azteca]
MGKFLTLFFLVSIFNKAATGLTVERTDLFLTVSGFTYNKALAYATERVSKECRCSGKCATDPKCQMFGGYLAQDSYYCSRYNATPVDFEQQPFLDPGAFLSVRVEQPDMQHEPADGFVYWLSKDVMTITAARSLCQKMKGFRLGFYQQDNQVPILQKYYQQSGGADSLLISLTKNATTGDAVWDDGSPYAATGAYANLIVNDGSSSSSVYAYGLNGKINDVPATYLGKALCQGKPFFRLIQ